MKNPNSAPVAGRNVVVVGKDIADANGLRGKTFAIPHRSSSHNILFREVLERNNIPEKDVKLIELPPPEMPSALASGREGAGVQLRSPGFAAGVCD